MSIAPGAHGGDGPRVARALGVAVHEVLDLSHSLNPLMTSSASIVARHAAAVGRYPDPSAAHAALAATMGVAPDELALTNGGAEAIALVAAECGGRVEEPSFSLHPRGGTALWRANPSTPMGQLARPEDVADVWDEAFYPLASGRWTRGDVARGAVVVGSLTKVLACPGLRLGYVLAAPDFVARIRRRQPEWSVNSLACEALPELLDACDLAASYVAVARLRESLVELLRGHGLEVRATEANWVLVDQPGLRDALITERIVVRDCTSFAMPGVVRVAVPDEDGLATLDAALTRLGPWSKEVRGHQREKEE